MKNLPKILPFLLALCSAPVMAQSGGATYQFPTTGWSAFAPARIECGRLIGANMNSTADQPIPLSFPTASYVVDVIDVSSPSVSLTTAAGGFYTGAGKTGITLVASGQAYSTLTTSAVNTTGNEMSATLAAAASTTRLSLPTIYLSLTTAQGAAATANVRVYCRLHY